MLERFVYKSEARIYGLFKSHTLLYRLVRKFKGVGKSLVKPQTDLCLEGFPRSANTYANQLLKTTNPQLRLAHHTHAVVNIKLALRFGIPSFILIRTPIDAIASAVIRRNSLKSKNDVRNIIYAIEMYRHFYSFVQSKKFVLHVVKFETIIKEPLEFIMFVKARSNLSIFVPEDTERIDSLVRSNIDTHKREIGSSFRASALPEAERDVLKQKITNRLKNYEKEMRHLRWLYDNLTGNGRSASHSESLM